MLTVEKLRKIVTEAYENDEWICLRSGGNYSIFKLQSKDQLENFMSNMIENVYIQNGVEVYEVDDAEDNTVYTDADHAKDWNYFKNTMGI